MKILVAGGTGYLGSFILKQLSNTNMDVYAVVRDGSKVDSDIKDKQNIHLIEAELTDPVHLLGVCNDIDVVISTVGITRQKDGLTYMDVDYEANKNLLDEAMASQVKRFLYVSVFNGEKMRHTSLVGAKEKFVDALQNADISSCVIRPNGFFSDMKDFLEMAKKGKVYLFGNGRLKMNPIHGSDLAKEIINVIDSDIKEVNIGGPDTFTHTELATLALKAYNKPVKIIYIPDLIRRIGLRVFVGLTKEKRFGPIEFFMTAMGMNMAAPTYGQEHLSDFFDQVVERESI